MQESKPLTGKLQQFQALRAQRQYRFGDVRSALLTRGSRTLTEQTEEQIEDLYQLVVDAAKLPGVVRKLQEDGIGLGFNELDIIRDLQETNKELSKRVGDSIEEIKRLQTIRDHYQLQLRRSRTREPSVPPAESELSGSQESAGNIQDLVDKMAVLGLLGQVYNHSEPSSDRTINALIQANDRIKLINITTDIAGEVAAWLTRFHIHPTPAASDGDVSCASRAFEFFLKVCDAGAEFFYVDLVSTVQAMTKAEPKMVRTSIGLIMQSLLEIIKAGSVVETWTGLDEDATLYILRGIDICRRVLWDHGNMMTELRTVADFAQEHCTAAVRESLIMSSMLEYTSNTMVPYKPTHSLSKIFVDNAEAAGRLVKVGDIALVTTGSVLYVVKNPDADSAIDFFDSSMFHITLEFNQRTLHIVDWPTQGHTHQIIFRNSAENYDILIRHFHDALKRRAAKEIIGGERKFIQSGLKFDGSYQN